MRRFEGFKKLDYTFGYLMQHFCEKIGYRYISVDEINSLCNTEGLHVDDMVIAGISLYTHMREEYLEETAKKKRLTQEEKEIMHNVRCWTVDEIVFNLEDPKL